MSLMGAVTLTAMTVSHVASSTSPAGRNQSMTPALLTRMSAPPCAPAAMTTASTPSVVVRSTATWTTWPGMVSSPLSSSSRSTLRSAAMTTAPSAAMRNAMALPMPDAAPVTMATRPSSLSLTVPPSMGPPRGGPTCSVPAGESRAPETNVPSLAACFRTGPVSVLGPNEPRQEETQ